MFIDAANIYYKNFPFEYLLFMQNRRRIQEEFSQMFYEIFLPRADTYAKKNCFNFSKDNLKTIKLLKLPKHKV